MSGRDAPGACDHPRTKFSLSVRLGGITYRCRKCLTCGDSWWTFEAFYGRNTPPNVKAHYAAQEAARKKTARDNPPSVPALATVWSKHP